MKSRQLLSDVALLLLALAASWPLVELTSSSALVGPALAVVALVWFVGALCRFTHRTPAFIVTAQLVALAVEGADLAGAARSSEDDGRNR